jgi:hypothetical protein
MGNETFRLSFTVDDGMIVYVNGVEAMRYNMPGGNVTYNTYATTYAQGNPDSGTANLNASLFRQGTNVIAVEVHNNSGSSTDIYWSASLSKNLTSGGELVCSDPEYELPASSRDLIASFEPIASTDTPLPPVVINEVSSDNGIYINDLWKKSDWIELYNTTNQDIDLAGMYLSDKVGKPDKWQIGSDLAADASISTIIPAHGYRIVWCDKEEGIRDLHAPFKLENVDQSQVILSAADGSWHDTLTYCAHLPAETVGRYPDASRNVYLMTRTTIERTNQLTTIAATVDQPAESAIQQVLSDDILDDRYSIFDLNGRLVREGRGSLAEDLPSGVYIVRSKGTAYKVMVP